MTNSAAMNLHRVTIHIHQKHPLETKQTYLRSQSEESSTLVMMMPDDPLQLLLSLQPSCLSFQA